MNDSSADNSGSASPRSVSDRETDSAVDGEIISHFDKLNDAPAPGFEEMWQRARSQAGSAVGKPQDQQYSSFGKRYRAPLAVAATAMVLAMLVMTSVLVEDSTSVMNPSLQMVNEIDKDAVFKELIATTRWRAPSDELLNRYATLQVGNVPQFDWLDNFASEKS